MKPRWQRALLLFSLAVNIAFVSLAAVRIGSGAASQPQARFESPTSQGPFIGRWHARRAGMLSRLLQLDAAQREALEIGLRDLGPQLRASRLRAFRERAALEASLARQDAAAARVAAQRVSAAQSALDSLTAEAMLREIAVLRPEQRERYLRLTFRPAPWRALRRGLVPGMTSIGR